MRLRGKDGWGNTAVPVQVSTREDLSSLRLLAKLSIRMNSSNISAVNTNTSLRGRSSSARAISNKRIPSPRTGNWQRAPSMPDMDWETALRLIPKGISLFPRRSPRSLSGGSASSRVFTSPGWPLRFLCAARPRRGLPGEVSGLCRREPRRAPALELLCSYQTTATQENAISGPTASQMRETTSISSYVLSKLIVMIQSLRVDSRIYRHIVFSINRAVHGRRGEKEGQALFPRPSRPH